MSIQNAKGDKSITDICKLPAILVVEHCVHLVWLIVPAVILVAVTIGIATYIIRKRQPPQHTTTSPQDSSAPIVAMEQNIYENTLFTSTNFGCSMAMDDNCYEYDDDITYELFD